MWKNVRRFFMCCIFVIGMLIVEIIVLKPDLISLREKFRSNHSGRFDITKHQEIDWQNYTTVGQNKFYIFSVLAAKSARNRTWDLIVVNGREIGKAKNETYRCCFFDGDGANNFSTTNNKRFFLYDSKRLGSRQVVCQIPQGIVPKTFKLVLLSEDCVTSGIHKNVVYPKPEKDGKFAICGKTVYGEKNPNHLIEWIEYQRYMGASKIVLYPYQDLNRDALKVVQYYSDAGVIEAVPYPYVPMRKKWPRYFSQTPFHLKFNDEQLPIFDTQERLREYTYFTVIDTDEFIAPNRSIAKNYSQLVDYLVQKYNNAANFLMLSQIHAMSWNKTKPGSDLMLEQFGNRSQSIRDRVKFIHVTDRIVPGSAWTHDGVAKPGYDKVVMKDTEAVLKHYRFCTEKWLKPGRDDYKPNRCFGGFKVQYDPYMDEVIEAIGPRVRKTKQILRL